MINPADLPEVIRWLATVGAAIVTGYLFSFLADKWQKWNELPKEVRFVVPMVISVLISLAATWLLSRPDIIEQFAPIFGTIMTAILVYLGSQKSHADSNKAKSESITLNDKQEAQG